MGAGRVRSAPNASASSRFTRRPGSNSRNVVRDSVVPNRRFPQRSARADSIPGLEIEANEVRCTHGATVSPVEEEHLFYLMSRGIDRVTAQKLVVFGFFGEVLDRIRVQSVRDELSDAISKKVEGSQTLEMSA